VHSLTEKQKAIAAIVIVVVNVGYGFVLSKLDGVFSFFVILVTIPIWASLAWATSWYFSDSPPIDWFSSRK
jgi:hypothetical protein